MATSIVDHDSDFGCRPYDPAERRLRGCQIYKSFNNIKIIIGINFGSTDSDNQNLIEETNCIFVEIRSDADPSDLDDPFNTSFNPNLTFTLGLKITYWRRRGGSWVGRSEAWLSGRGDL